MKIDLTRTNNNVLFKVENSDGASAYIDGSIDIGGVNGGLRPMEMVLAAVATCSAFEIVNIFKKQRQTIKNFSITVDGQREKKESSKPFSKIHVVFSLSGNIDAKKANRAADLAINKYCSAKASLHPDIEVTYMINITD